MAKGDLGSILGRSGDVLGMLWGGSGNDLGAPQGENGKRIRKGKEKKNKLPRAPIRDHQF